MIDIVVVGYPKSGNTWVSRLVGELVGCPVVGFLGEDSDEIAREGLDRKSQYQCFKSHHQLDELRKIEAVNPRKVIYVIRDPRDVCLSGSRFFQFDRFPSVTKLLRAIPQGRRIVRKIFNKFLLTEEYRIQAMMNAVLFGSPEVHQWVEIAWRDHYRPYSENGYFFVKYEDLLSDSEQECRRILTFLGVAKSTEEIRACIDKQSFGKKKEEFLKLGEKTKANFMKVGKKEQWREGLSEEHKRVFLKMLKGDLARFGYPLQDRDTRHFFGRVDGCKFCLRGASQFGR